MLQDDLKSLVNRPERRDRSVLSVYLNVDQSQQVNFNRGFENQFKKLLASLRKPLRNAAEIERFRKAERRLEDFVSAYQANGRGLVMFFDASDGFFWRRDLAVPVENAARWDRELLMEPLAAATDDFERYGVALADRSRARLFTIFLGEIQECIREEFDHKKVRHIKTVGMDHLGSASRAQRRADEQVRGNLRRAVQDIEWLVKVKEAGRLVLAGTPEIISELRGLLPKRLALRVIGAADLKVDASIAKVLTATRRLTEQYERDTEEQMVKEVVTSAAKQQRAVVGLSRTLKNVNQDRIWQLVYSEDFHSPGFECSKCSSLFSSDGTLCSYCGASVVPVGNVVKRAVEHALRRGAKIEVVRGEAASTLDTAGGIGAFLKTRTASVRT
jgi:peptide subunit release factor 1 (eRF1)